MNSFFIPSENSIALKDAEGINIGVYLFPFIDMLVLGVIVLAVWGPSKIIGTVDILPAVISVIALMFIHIVAFQIGLSPSHMLCKKLRRSMILRYDDCISILTCVPDKKLTFETSFTIRGLSRIDREIEIQRFASEYMKQNYFLSGRAGVDDIYTTEYTNVALLKERKKYYIFSGIEKKSEKKKKFKIYKAYTDIYKITEGLTGQKDKS